MGQESYKAMRRRAHELKYVKYFAGTGIDVGCGEDRIIKFKDKMHKMRFVRCWDVADGDGQYLEGVGDMTQDFVHHSHSLEHMRDWKIALTNWLRVVKPGGYVIGCVPDWELYEHGMWPSRYNSDHKWAFTLDDRDNFPFLVHLDIEMLESNFKCKVLELKRMEDGYDWNDMTRDQTAYPNGPECCIEIVLKRK